MTPNFTKKTIIANEDFAIEDLATLDFVVRAIFKDQLNQNIYKELLQYLFDKRDKSLSHAAVAAFSQEFLISKLSQTNCFNVEILQAMQTVAQHVQDYEFNSSAYTPSRKINPNTVFWPDPTNEKESRNLLQEEPWAECYNFIDRSTSIGSAGSCFAMEIAHWLQKSGYNYLVKENVISSDKSGNNYKDSSASWGIIFNVPSLSQLILKAFGEIELPRILWYYDQQKCYWDPFRENIKFASVDEYEVDCEKHINACREVFLNTEVFVMTLGLNEVWTMKDSGFALSKCPWSVSPALVKTNILTVEENVSHLQRMLDVWRVHNPKLKLIVTVSPVPLHATFRGEKQHVISANCHSKATLRLAAEEFVKRNKDVFYFPSYEKVMYCTQNPWEADQRHVSRETVSGVMQLFSKMFLKED